MTTELFHEGQRIYRLVEERTDFEPLKGVEVVLHYMNSYKKAYFKRETGLHLVDFGSVMLFVKGYRVPPYGDRGNDWLGIDSRKNQATGRNLGGRELLGMINIHGTDLRIVSNREGVVIRAVHDRLEAGKQVELCKRLLDKMRPVVKSLKVLVKEGEHAHFKDVEKLIDAIVALDPVDFETLVKSRSFNSSQRVDMAVSLCKEHEHLKGFKEDVGNIKQLLDWRNALAHQKPTKQVGGFPVFEIRNSVEEAFDTARTLQLRKDLRAQRALLQAMLKALKA